jgi:hypothetical protein
MLKLEKSSICLSDITGVLKGGTPAGGVFKGFGVSNGVISTQIAGVGTHDIYYQFTDSNGCLNSDTDQVFINPNPIFAVSNDTAVCRGSRIELKASNYQAKSSLKWSNGTIGELLQDYPGSSTTYAVQLTDSIGCSSSKSVIVNVLPAISILPTVQKSTCNEKDGAISVVAQGGLAPYRYEWSTGEKVNVITGKKSGIYNVSVSDGNSCASSKTITLNSKTGPQILINTIVNPTCNGSSDGAIDLTIVGSNVQVKWNNGATTEDINGLTAGTYTLEAKDETGCVIYNTFTLSEPDAIGGDVVTSKSGCNQANAFAYAQVFGGTGSYTFNWSSGFSGDTVKNLSSGAYAVEVRDANGCSDSLYFAISDSGAPQISVIRVLPTPCGQTNGEAEIEVVADSIASISWSSGDTALAVQNLASGKYQVAVSDTAGCVGVERVLIPSISPILNPLCLATIDTATGHPQLLHNVNSSDFGSLKIYELELGETPEQVKEEVPNTTNIYTDQSADATVRSYGYAIAGVNNCNGLSAVSLTHRTIYMRGNITPEGTITLSWTPYIGHPVIAYDILRITENGTTVINSLPGSSHKYVINNEDFSANTIKYVVRASLDNGSCNSGNSYYDHSYSNYSPNFGSFTPGYEQADGLGIERVYPNPNNGEFTVELISRNSEDVTLEILDMRGRLVFQQTENQIYGFKRFQINLEDEAVGLYQLRISGGDEVRTLKVQVTR